MHLQERLVKLDELAVALGRKEDWLKRNWLRLHQAEGMPRKVAGTWAWPRKALENWIEGHALLAETETVPAIGGLTAIAANENARLRARYGGGRA